MAYKWDEARPQALELALALSLRGVPVWLDSLVLHGTRPGTADAALQSLIRLGIRRSRAVVALSGPLYETDRDDEGSWVARERSAAEKSGRTIVDLALHGRAWIRGAVQKLERVLAGRQADGARVIGLCEDRPRDRRHVARVLGHHRLKTRRVRR